MKMLEKRHIMIDIETLSTHQTAAPISIGAVEFDFKKGIGRKFSINIDKSEAFKYNLHISKSTLEWWKSQPTAVWESVTSNPVPLIDALEALNSWYKETYARSNPYVWANGSVFDFGILRNCYEKTKIEIPWKYWVEMDLRTISTTLDVKLSSGNNHNALDDAVNQAEQLIKMLS